MFRYLAFALTFVLLSYGSLTCHADDWPRFRGPDGNGVATESSVPTAWSPKANLAWKTEMPGPGASSPIIVGDRVFVTCYSGYGLSQEDVPARLEIWFGIWFALTWRRARNCGNRMCPPGPGGSLHGNWSHRAWLCFPYAGFGRHERVCLLRQGWRARVRYGRQRNFGKRRSARNPIRPNGVLRPVPLFTTISSS